jgi:uncharacterized membrane protein (UPF0127 family)
MKLIVNNKEFNLVIAKSFFKKLSGLMFKKEISENLVFIHCSSIHTFFMRKNIDVLFFDKNKKLIEIHKDVHKNKILICKKAYYTVEILSNKIKLDGTIKLV